MWFSLDRAYIYWVPIVCLIYLTLVFLIRQEDIIIANICKAFAMLSRTNVIGTNHIPVLQMETYLFVVVQSLSCVRFFMAPWTSARQASLSFTISQGLLRLMSTDSISTPLFPIYLHIMLTLLALSVLKYPI